MIQIAQPFQNFVDTSGQPLDNGFIYIGTTNQNPETNQIAVYWDAALTIPAAQPIRTINGYMARNGSPARLYANVSSYSITVRDRNSAIVLTTTDASTLDNLRADLAASSGTTLIGWIRSAVGAVATTLAKWMGWQEPTLFEFMTDAQVTDVQNRALTLDVSAAVAAAVLANPNKIIRAPAGSYKLTSGTALAAAQHIRGDGPTSTIFSCADAFDAFTLSSSYSGVSDCGFTSPSARTANAYVKLSAATRGNFVRRSKMTNAFYGVWIAAEAVINYFEDIELASIAPTTGVGIFINGGNDTFLTRVVADNPNGSQPRAGVRIKKTQAVWMTDCDFIHCGIPLEISPDTGDIITWCFFNNSAFDSSSGNGIEISPTGTASIRGLFFNGCWSATNNRGVYATKAVGATLDTVQFKGMKLLNNQLQGGLVASGSNFDFDDCAVAGNSQAASGVSSGLEFSNSVSNFAVRDTRSGAIAGFSASQAYGALIGTTCDSYVINGNNFTGNVTAGLLDNSKSTSASAIVTDNLGAKTNTKGTATVTTGNTEVTVTHGLFATPDSVRVTPLDTNVGALVYWASTRTATTFKINLSGAAGSNMAFSWSADCYDD